MPYIKSAPEMALVIQQISLVNTLKLPAPMLTKTSHEQLISEFSKYKDINIKQIEMLNPDVIIAGNVLYLYKEELGLDEQDRSIKGSTHFFSKDGRLYIDAYHPAQRTIKRQVYVDEIISIVKEWWDENNNK
jgi:hypothetical protein